MNNEQTNPAAVQQIKNARANNMGALIKPKTVVRVKPTAMGEVAQGSGVRVVKGYVDSGEDYEAYGGKKHRHLAPPKNIMQHLSQDHGWDNGDFERSLMANPTERYHEFDKTLRGHHADEHLSRANVDDHRTQVSHAPGDSHGSIDPSVPHEHKPNVPDALPDDIKNMRLDKSGSCSWCDGGESPEQVSEKMSAAHKSVSPGEFAERAVKNGTQSGLVSPKGEIYAKPGYAKHGSICSAAGVQHAYGALMRKHGWARLTGPEGGRGDHVGIEIKHNLGSKTREAVEDVATYTEGHGGRLSWDCDHPDGTYHNGSDHNSLVHHLSRLQNSFAKGRGLWLRLNVQGFEGRPISLKRTKRGLAFRKGIGFKTEQSENPKAIRTVVLVKSNPSVRSIKRFTAKHVKPEHWTAADSWLHGAKQTIEERTGGTPITHEGIQIGRAPTREHVAQGLAAMSPRQGWGAGAFAFDKVHGREMVGNKDNRGIGLGNSVRRARTAIRGGGMGSGRNGKKTRALADLTQGGSSLPMDIHADRVVHYGRKPDHQLGQVVGKRHEAHAEAFRTAASDMGHDSRRFFVATWHAARDWKGKTSTGIRAARANEDSAGQPNVLQHTGLWPGSTRDPKLLMNSKTVWSKLPEGLRSEVKLGRMPRGSFTRLVANGEYIPATKRLELGPAHLRAKIGGIGTGVPTQVVRRTRAEKDWTVAHEAGHHLHVTRHQGMGADDWHSLPSHEKDYLTSRIRGLRNGLASYSGSQLGTEGLAEGYAHLLTNQGGLLKRNAPQAHAMLTAKLDNAKKYWKSRAIYAATACLEKGVGKMLLPAESSTITIMTAEPQGGGV